MKMSLSKIAVLFFVAIFLGMALDRIFAKNKDWNFGSSNSKSLTLINLNPENGTATERLENKWLNVQGDLMDIQIDAKGEIILKINSPMQENGLSCFFKENIKSKDLDQLYSNQKVQLKGLCKKVGKKLVLVDCKII